MVAYAIQLILRHDLINTALKSKPSTLKYAQNKDPHCRHAGKPASVPSHLSLLMGVRRPRVRPVVPVVAAGREASSAGERGSAGPSGGDGGESHLPQGTRPRVRTCRI